MEERWQKQNILFFLGGLVLLLMAAITSTLFMGDLGTAIVMQLDAVYVTVYYAGVRLWFHLYRDCEL